MKIVCVVDSVTNIMHKIDMLKNRFGDNIIYVVKNKLAPLFKTYGYTPNAIYTTNLSKVIHVLLSNAELYDTVIYYTSLALTNDLLNKFISRMADKSKVVFVKPNYNTFEKMCYSTYNLYVRSLFKMNDSLASPKLQFLPKAYVAELLQSHFANKLFELSEEYSTTINIHDKEMSKSLKPKKTFNRFTLISLIVALSITIGLILCLAFIGATFLVILGFVCLYLLDLVLAIIFKCKDTFDKRFLH